MNNIMLKIGDAVEFVGYDGKRRGYEWEPPIGTVGRVIELVISTFLVQWPSGSTIDDDRWWHDERELAALPNYEEEFSVDPNELDSYFAEM